MKKWKQRLVMLLCLALIVPTLSAAMPQQVQAYSRTYVTWDNSISKYDRTVKFPSAAARIMVEQGQKFILSDYVKVSTYKNGNSTSKTAYELKGYKYKSSKAKVAAISKKGVLTTKKTGTTQVTVTVPQRGARPMVCTIQVVKKGSLTKQLKKSAEVNTILNELEKCSDKKVNDEVAAALYPQLEKAANLLSSDYYNTWDSSYKGMMKHDYGCIYAKNSYSQKFSKLVMPKYGTYMRLRRNMANYVNQQKAGTISGMASVTESATGGIFELSEMLTTAQYIRLFKPQDTFSEYSFIGNSGIFAAINQAQPVEVMYSNGSQTDYLDVNLYLKFMPNTKQVAFTVSEGVKLVPGNYVTYNTNSPYKNLKLTVTPLAGSGDALQQTNAQ